jgi:hypothetical protein
MTRRTIEQRLAQLDAQKKTLQSRLGKQERARDTRRKVLLGALLLHRLQTGTTDRSSAWLRTWLSIELPDFLTRDMDKTLLADLMSVPDPVPNVSPSIFPMVEAAVPDAALQSA